MTKKLYYFFILISAIVAQNSLSLPDVEGDVGDSLI